MHLFPEENWIPIELGGGRTSLTLNFELVEHTDPPENHAAKPNYSYVKFATLSLAY
jgi:hypothetical protein